MQNKQTLFGRATTLASPFHEDCWNSKTFPKPMTIRSIRGVILDAENRAARFTYFANRRQQVSQQPTSPHPSQASAMKYHRRRFHTWRVVLRSLLATTETRLSAR